MKKLILTALAVFSLSLVSAQSGEQTSKGKWLVEANTGFGGLGNSFGTGVGHSANTGIQFYSIEDGGTGFNIGLEGGYFIINNLAIKAGLGYGSFSPDSDIVDDTNTFSYKIGAKYYIINQIPVQLDYTGSSTKDVDDDPSYIGLQAGYAWFVGDMISIEPGFRYNLSTDDEVYANYFQLNVGFALHF